MTESLELKLHVEGKNTNFCWAALFLNQSDGCFGNFVEFILLTFLYLWIT